MAETDTITKNAVQELMELPVARKPLTVEIEPPSRFEAKVQKICAQLEGITCAQMAELRRDRFREQHKDVPVARMQYVYGWSRGLSMPCMPSRNRLLGL